MKYTTNSLMILLLSFSITFSSMVPISAEEINVEQEYDLDISVVYEDEDVMEIIIPAYVVEENPELFPDLYNELINQNSGIQPRGVVLSLLGKILVNAVAGVITHCVTEVWGSGNACARALDWATKPRFPAPNFTGTVRYNVYGKFTPGRVPGCQPMHSGPCNSGYWTVRYENA